MGMQVRTFDILLSDGKPATTPLVDAVMRLLEQLCLDWPDVFRRLTYVVRGYRPPGDEPEDSQEIVDALLIYGLCDEAGTIPGPIASVIRVATMPGAPVLLNPVKVWTAIRPYRVNEINYFLRDKGGEQFLPYYPRYEESI